MFDKYPKIPEGGGGGAGAAGSWIVTEKVHGANFSIVIRRGAAGAPCAVTFAKRSGEIGGERDAEDFYSVRSTGLLSRLTVAGRAVFAAVCRRRDGVERVQVYGELYGGRYPHPAVPAVPGLAPVQRGVWYAPGLHFVAFDVAVTAQDGRRRFLDVADGRAVCAGSHLPFVRSLATGTLAACLAAPVEFETTVPTAHHGLPSVGPDNVAEGVVIRPAREPLRGDRGLFKLKIAAFSEKRYANDAFAAARGGGAPFQVPASRLLEWELAAVATPQRVDAVLSKIGRVSADDRAGCRAVLAATIADCEDALEPADRAALAADPVAQAYLRAECKRAVAQRLIGRPAPAPS